MSYINEQVGVYNLVTSSGKGWQMQSTEQPLLSQSLEEEPTWLLQYKNMLSGSATGRT